MKVLVIAPHFDDEVLGAGGIINKYSKKGEEVYVCVVTKGCEPLFSKEDTLIDLEECKQAHKVLGVKNTYCLGLKAACLSSLETYKLNKAIMEAINTINPDELYIPFYGDMHIDHRLIADACMVAIRPTSTTNLKRVYAYETLSETGWNVANSNNAFIPNVYVDIKDNIDAKLEAMECYKHQIKEYPSCRSAKGIKALAMYRGSNVNLEYAESFMLIREIK